MGLCFSGAPSLHSSSLNNTHCSGKLSNFPCPFGIKFSFPFIFLPKEELSRPFFLRFESCHEGWVPLFSGSSDIHGSKVESSAITTIRETQSSVITRGSIDSLCSRSPPPPLSRFIPPSLLSFPRRRILKSPELKVFSFEELKSVTRNFWSDRLLGEGKFARVYKGWVDENTLTPVKPGSGVVVAIKMLNPESSKGFQLWQVALFSSLSTTFFKPWPKFLMNWNTSSFRLK